MKVDFSTLTFIEAKETIRDTLQITFGKEWRYSTDRDSADSYDMSATYGIRSVYLDMFTTTNETLSVAMVIESGIAEEDPELRADSNKMFKILGLVPSPKNKGKVFEFKGTNTFEYLSPEKANLKKMGKFKDLLKFKEV